MMHASSANTFLLLRRALSTDAAISGATGLLLVFAAGLLESVLSIPEELLRYAGFVLLPFAAWLAILSRKSVVAATKVWVAIIANVLWVAASVYVALSDQIVPNGLGIAFVLLQASVVAAFAVMQYLALQKTYGLPA